MNPITNDNQIPIKPEHISLDGSFMGSIWENMETEVSAYWLIKFARDRKSWAPFNLAELADFYHKKHPDSQFWFNKLFGHRTDPDYIHKDDFGNFFFTKEFIVECYRLSPE